ERESFYQNQIETMQRLLEAPKPKIQDPSELELPKSAPIVEMKEEVIVVPPKDDGLTTPVEIENKRIPVPEHVEPEQPKRGWLSRFFLPNG
ncbi:DNA-binding protein, partial [Acinetobacter baumannii]